MSGRTYCDVVDRSDVLRLAARAAGCKSCLDRSGPGRIVRRLQAASGYSLRKLVARAASRSPIDGRLRREPIAAQ